MTVEEARKLYEKYKEEIHQYNNHENEDALFEITEFLLKETKDPWYSSDLGSFYYGRQQYDLAKKDLLKYTAREQISEKTSIEQRNSSSICMR